jgi:hypothetical protein
MYGRMKGRKTREHKGKALYKNPPFYDPLDPFHENRRAYLNMSSDRCRHYILTKSSKNERTTELAHRLRDYGRKGGGKKE